MAEVLRDFCHLSGQKMNIDKSRLWVSPNTVGREVALRAFGISITYDLGLYLGVPLLHGAPKRGHYQYLFDKVQQRLSG